MDSIIISINTGLFTLSLLLLPCFLLSNEASALDSATNLINVVSLGAKRDGRTDASQAFRHAWSAACGSRDPVTIYVPDGTFFVRQGRFAGPCRNTKIEFRIRGTLVAPSDYDVIGSAGSWLAFEQVDGVSVHGGKLSGQGAAIWACKRSGKNCPNGATNLSFTKAKNILVSGVTSQNSQMFHLVINGCHNVTLQHIRIAAPAASPNTDGIHVQFSSAVTLRHSAIATGDDCISIGPGTANLSMQNLTCGPGHGISIGSLGREKREEGVENITLEGGTLKDTQNGVRIKAWGKPSNGFVKSVVFKDLTMVNVLNPILIDQNYCPRHHNCPRQASGVRISDVTYEDIKGTSASEVAVKFECSKVKPCKGITMKDVKLSFKESGGGNARASCAYAAGMAVGLIQPSSCL
ncbi:hypothetical protein DM860_005685 [Cuscuta australis]|uniref:Pectate lyase superfamily protein domain-containing protein n=1 Tax=Cuscuta australis TaxID=267555 RepID=A0A328DVR1_9ASTE|nr:hypothetical protein DM860_005685 [Cuscuta australis]